ncbi:MAG: helix-turn-helix domain-containing protein [Chitinophagaceae bacterium]|nr:helix-turn-helix domain-containing protein [Chitinophagaceae bacterium]
MKHSSGNFPVLSISGFSEDQSPRCNVLFHELRGVRSIDDPHKHDFFVIMLFERGSGTHTIDFIPHRIKSHQVHLLFPGQVHQWKMTQQTIGYQLMISREWFEWFLPSLRFSVSYYQNHPVMDISEGYYQLLLYEFRAIREELNGANITWALVQTRCQLICILISKIAEGGSADFEGYHSNPIVTKYTALVDLHFKQEHSVTFYAGKLHISANYLNIVCRKNLHAAASSLIYDRILLEAKRLLKVSEMSVKDIVYALGFYDHANFSKFFRSQTGMTPTQFKEL